MERIIRSNNDSLLLEVADSLVLDSENLYKNGDIFQRFNETLFFQLSQRNSDFFELLYSSLSIFSLRIEDS